jgi:hypothetical protein
MEQMYLKNKKPVGLIGKKILTVSDNIISWPDPTIHNMVSKPLAKYLHRGHRISHAVLWIIKDNLHGRVYYDISFCSAEDTFDLKYGLRMARDRAVEKFKQDNGWKECIVAGLFSGIKKHRPKKKAGANDRTKSNE